MDPVDLDRQLDEALHQLPGPRAPRTLLPRVMAAAAQRAEVPWYARGWSAWSRGWQLASALAACLVVVGGFVALRVFESALQVSTSPMARLATGQAATLLEQIRAASALFRVTWQVLIEPIGLFVLALSVVMMLAVAALWTALDRVALGEVQQS